MANKKFSTLKNDFCIIFQKWSQINEAKDDGSISNQVFDFTTIEEIADLVGSRAVDVCGVICQIGEKESINLKSGGSKSRKQLSLVDDTNCSIQLTMWGDDLCDKGEACGLG